ncbi:MAG TPA: HAD family hydrolase [Actinopolymorphaceae bacterium]|nr:HAD family hydrolase [Actinopolymorphaceae bacterium]
MTPRSSVRVVALDLDGTILEPGKVITDQVIDALRSLRERGIRCVTASGRPVDFQLALLDRHGLGADSGCFQALITDERELHLCETAAEGARFRPDEEWNDQVHRRWRRLAGTATHWLERAREEARRRALPGRIELKLDEVEPRGLATIGFDNPESAAVICDWLSDQLVGVEGLACNRNVTLVQIYDESAGKGNVLARLAKLWLVEPAEVLAIGDTKNDEVMLDGSLGYLAATVANADDDIKTAVRRSGGYVASGRIGAGVIEALAALV